MSTTIICPNCGTRLKTRRDDLWGRKVKCKECGGAFTARKPGAEAISLSLSAACPGCSKEFIHLPADDVGKLVKCPDCDAEFRLGEKQSPSGEWAVGRTVLDIYQITDELGRGGMGAVHRVRHLGWNLDLAVKSPLSKILEKKNGPENFEREAETWINLPLHPHIVSCYYVRRIYDIPRVFAEYVDGGSLADWISSRSLYQGGPDESLKRILDVAIQFAWGLDFSHEKGLVHQDVKPGNVMLTSDGLVKVTDFGLARAMPMDMSAPDGADMTMMVKKVGMTQAYASPEQASGEPLTRRTDLWSWAVSVLEMFTGEVTWSVGVAAGLALASYRAIPAEDSGIPQMPEKMADLLDECFRDNPNDRPHDLNEAAERLIDIYNEATSEAYPRRKPRAGRSNPDHLNNRALSLIDLGREEEALSHFNRALEVEPHHPEAVYNRGLYRWRAGEITDLDLVDELEMVRQTHTETWVDEYYLSLVHRERGDYESAVNVLESIEGQDAQRPEIIETLGKIGPMAAEPRHQKIGLKGSSGGLVEKASFSRDGRLIIIKYADKNHAEVFALDNGNLLSTLEGHANFVTSVLLSHDGQLAVTGSSDETARVWDAQTGRLLNTFKVYSGFFNNSQGVNALYLTGDKKRLYTGGLNRVIKEWDLSTGELLAEFPLPDDGMKNTFITAIDVDEARGRLVSSDNRATLRIWDLQTRACLKSFDTPGKQLLDIKFSRDGRYLLSGDTQEKVIFWNLEDGSVAFEKWGHKWRTSCCTFSHDNKYFLTGGWSDGLKLWEASKSRCLRTFGKRDPFLKVHGLCFLGEKAPLTFLAKPSTPGVDKWLFDNQESPWMLSRVTGSEETLLNQEKYEEHISRAREALAAGRLDVVLDQTNQARNLPGHSRGREALDLLGDLYSRLPVRTLRGGWEAASIKAHEKETTSLAVSPDGKLIMTGTTYMDQTGNLKIWDSQTLELVAKAPGQLFAITNIAFTPDGKQALIVRANHPLVLVDIETLQIKATFDKCFNSALALTPNGEFLFSHGDKNDPIKMFEISTGRCIRTFAVPSDTISQLALTPDGQYLSRSLPQQKRRLVWDIASGQEKMVNAAEEIPFVFSAAFRINQSAVIRGNRVLNIWDCLKGEVIRQIDVSTPGDAFSEISSMVLSPDQRFALIGMFKNGLQVWALDNGAHLATFLGHIHQLKNVAVSPEGRFAYSVGYDGFLKKWELDWELEFKEQTDWDNGAKPVLINFLTLHTPRLGPLPTDGQPTEEEIVKHLTRRGRPVWTEEDFQGLLTQLGHAGYGWLKPEGVRNKLAELAAAWTEPPDYWSAYEI